MNQIVAKAKVKEYRIVYTYMYDNRMYEIETPRTDLNVNVKDGQLIDILLGIMPHEDPKPVVEDVFITDE